MCVTSVGGFALISRDRTAIVEMVSPRESASATALRIEGDDPCKLTGYLYRERVLGPSDVFPHVEWVMNIVEMSCAQPAGADLVTRLNWEKRFFKSLEVGQSIPFPAHP